MFLYIFLDLSIRLDTVGHHHHGDSGTVGEDANFFAAIGVILSILPLTHGLASIMVLAVSFTKDGFDGFVFSRENTVKLVNFCIKRLFRFLQTVPVPKPEAFHLYRTGVVLLRRLPKMVEADDERRRAPAYNYWVKLSVDWTYFICFTVLPFVILQRGLNKRDDTFWEITGLFWIKIILVFFLQYVLILVVYEIGAWTEALRRREIVKYKVKDSDKGRRNESKANQTKSNQKMTPTVVQTTWWSAFKKAARCRQLATYSFYQKDRHVVVTKFSDLEISSVTKDGTAGRGRPWRTDSNVNCDMGLKKSLKDSVTQEFTMAWFLKTLGVLDLFGNFGLYDIVDSQSSSDTQAEETRSGGKRKSVCISYRNDSPERVWLTGQNWSVEKLFCNPHNSRTIVLLSGKWSLSTLQISSTVLTYMLGPFLSFGFVISLSTYLHIPNEVRSFLLVFAACLHGHRLHATYRIVRFLIRASRDDHLEDLFDVKSKRNLAVFMESQQHRVAQLKEGTWMLVLCFEVFFFFAYPLISLWGVGNFRMAGIFCCVAGFSGIRYFASFDAVKLTAIIQSKAMQSERRNSLQRHLESDQFQSNMRGRSRGALYAVLLMFCSIFLGLFSGAVVRGSEEEVHGYTATSEESTLTYVKNFFYEHQDELRYPACRLPDLGKSPLVNMVDFAYLAGHAYRGVKGSQQELDGFFQDKLVDREDLVRWYHSNLQVKSRVSFKLITTQTRHGTFAYVAIRGTTNTWDLMTDACLWSPSMLMQALRAILPFGSIWTPVMPPLIESITRLQSNSIREISFYKDTVDFVNWLKKSGNYTDIAVTGHSLGGKLRLRQVARGNIA